MRKIILFLISFSVTGFIFSQNVTVSGYIEDAGSGEKIPNASLFIKNLNKGTVSNNYGFYSITIPAGQADLSVSFIGCNSINAEYNFQRDTVINFLLEQAIELQEVTVTENKSSNSLKSSDFNINSIPLKEIAKVPVLFGESDVLKTLQLLPGIQAGQEGTGGLNVRGGSPDQNLILLDGAPVYNVNHLFGFFSVFNTEALKSVTILKGGFPARYGGRLSSVLDILMKEGNTKKLTGSFSVGLISSKFTIEGPIIKNKTSFMLSARRTYFDLLMKPLIIGSTPGNEKLKTGYFFYDLNAKINHQINEKNRLFLSFYSGKDKAYMNDEVKEDNFISQRIIGTYFDLNWYNTTATLRYNKIISNKIFLNTTLIYSKYNFSISNREKDETDNTVTGKMMNNNIYSFGSQSGIENYTVKTDFDFFNFENHSVKIGCLYTYHIFTPEMSSGTQIINDSVQTQTGTQNTANKVYANETAVYFEDDWNLTSRIKVNYGLRIPLFVVRLKYYSAAEPRISMRYLINDRFALKAAFSKMDQYIHLLSNSSVGLPTDLWVSSTDKLKPSNSLQFAAGSEINLKMFELNIEGFYKTLNNLIEYNEGAAVLGQSNSWENQLAVGKGTSFGCELMLGKTVGKTTGWISYTLMKSNRIFPDLNNGAIFPYKYDRRHSVAVVVTHTFSKKLDVGCNWVFNTGNAISFPVQKYVTDDGETVPYYSGRNSFRMPAYHRMDINANFYKVKKRGTRIFSVSIYNVYNRKNPYFIWISEDSDKPVLKQFTLFPIIPTVSYSFKFN
jgi:outer membrane receptor for ferrienterochelin and colicin